MYILSYDPVVQPSNAQHLVDTYTSRKTLTGQTAGYSVYIHLISLIFFYMQFITKTIRLWNSGIPRMLHGLVKSDNFRVSYIFCVRRYWRPKKTLCWISTHCILNMIWACNGCCMTAQVYAAASLDPVSFWQTYCKGLLWLSLYMIVYTMWNGPCHGCKLCTGLNQSSFFLCKQQTCLRQVYFQLLKNFNVL